MKTTLFFAELFVLLYSTEAHSRNQSSLLENATPVSRSSITHEIGQPETGKEDVMSMSTSVIMLRSLPFLNSNSSVLTNITNSSVAIIESSDFGLNGTQNKVSSATGITAVFGSSLGASPSNGQMTGQGGIKDGTLQNLLRYARFSAAAFVPTCPYPGGVTMVKQFGLSSAAQLNLPSAAMGFVARDDSNMELIVVSHLS